MIPAQSPPCPAPAAHATQACRAALISVITLSALTTMADSLSAQRMRIGSSNPTGNRGGRGYTSALFAAGDTQAGVELWKHDAAGTSRILDIYPGSISSYPTEITRRNPANGHTWLVARSIIGSAQFGRELRFYPGLPASPAGGWFKDIRPGAQSSHPAELTMVGKRLFFVADDGTSGRELWTSNGTVASTVRVRDIVPGAASSNPFGLIAYNGKLYFAATTPANGTELWTSDGTGPGTVLLRDIHAGVRSATPSHFAIYRNRLYFAATNAARGRELWSTTGTTASTVLVADIEPGPRSSSPTLLTAGNGLAFAASQTPFGRELFVLSGSVSRRSSFAAGESIAVITAAANQFWFRARTTLRGSELWRTTATGVAVVHDLRAGSGSSFPTNLYAFRNGVIFRANDGNKGVEYWRTNGTTATLIQDIRQNNCSSRPSVLTPISLAGRTTLLFSAKGNDLGIELWQTNGATAALVSNIDPLSPLPGMHWDTTQTTMTIDIKDADPGQPVFIAISPTTSRPLALRGFRGALSLGFPFFIIFQSRTDPRGALTISFPTPPILQRTALLSQAAIGTASGFIELTAAATCNHGSRDLNPPNGPYVEGRVCLDDESGEYSISALRNDNSNLPAYLGLYQKGPGGDFELLQTYPISDGELIEDSGQIELLLPLEGLDSGGRHLELHLFTEEPTLSSPTPATLVVMSYC